MNLFIQTSNKFFVKRSVERLKKVVSLVNFGLVQIESNVKSIVEKTFFEKLNQKEDHMKIDEKRVYDDFDIDDFVEDEISDDFNSKKQFFRQKSNLFTRK